MVEMRRYLKTGFCDVHRVHFCVDLILVAEFVIWQIKENMRFLVCTKL